MVTINGVEIDAAGKTVAEYLQQSEFKNTSRIAIERNLDILPKAEYETTVLQDGDSLEIVCFVGGG